jgi:glycosyltransferase involved in cell wall biosynthesis
VNPARGRICFHASYLYPLFSGGRIAFAGGAEVQQALLARGLAARGFEVSVVTCDYGQEREQRVDGVRLLRSYPPHGGVPGLRFFHPRLSLTLRALRAADAEAYYARGLGVPAGIAFDVARARRAAFALGTAHDLDVRRDLPLHRNPRDRWWSRRVLRGADAIVAQSETQRRGYREAFGRESEVIRNAVEIPASPVDAGGAGAVIWVGTYKRGKRPEWFLELARRLPELRFVMCGVPPVPPDGPEAWEAAQAAARACPNLEVLGFVDHARLPAVYARGALFVHTSPAEGFPNTLLEAWAHGLPGVSAVDPDGVVAREGLGASVGDYESLEREVRAWMADPAARRAAGGRARTFVAAHHAPEAVLDRTASLFDRLVAGVRAARARG